MIRIWWPAYRLLDIVLIVLGYVSFRFAFSRNSMSVVYKELKTAEGLANISESLPCMVWISNPNGEIVYMNKKFRQIVGDDHTKFACTHPDDVADVKRKWGEALDSGETFEAQYRLRQPDGSYRMHLSRALPVKNKDGSIAQWFGITSDIEEQQARFRNQSMMFHSISHDLRTPLNTINLYVELLRQSTTPESAEALAGIQEQADIAADMLNGLLELARAQLANERNVVTSFEASEIIESVMRTFSMAADKKGIEFRCESFPKHILRTDRNKLCRAIANLVDNAIKFTQKGSVVVRVREQGEGTLIEIQDTGPGIKDVSRIYEAFYQAGNPERDHRKGFGLGLKIAQNLIGQLGGTLDVRSCIPGCCFSITVPNLE